MPWQQLILHLAASDLAQAEALLELGGAVALSVRSGDDSELLEPEPGSTPLWAHVSVRALFAQGVELAPVVHALRAALPAASVLDAAPLPDEQWCGAHSKFPVQRIGARLIVAPADEPMDERQGTYLRLHMGLAFGTGSHATTRLCLEWLEAHVTLGARVLDYGTGSGVLALAALALGAARAWAVDIDPQALAAAGDNARLNGRGGALWIGSPAEFDALADARGTMHVIVANILAGPLEALALPFHRYLAPRGRIVLSGILESQCDRVEAAFAPHFTRFRRELRDGWARLDASAT